MDYVNGLFSFVVWSYVLGLVMVGRQDTSKKRSGRRDFGSGMDSYLTSFIVGFIVPTGEESCQDLIGQTPNAYLAR